MKTFKEMMKLIEEAERDPMSWVGEGIQFIQIDHIEDDNPVSEEEEGTEAPAKRIKGVKMINWVDDPSHPKAVYVKDAVTRRNLLAAGFRDALGIEIKFDDGTIEQRIIDPRFWDKFKGQKTSDNPKAAGKTSSEGWKEGWTNIAMINSEGKRKYVKDGVAHDKALAKGWRDYNPIMVSRKVAGKGGGEKFENTWMDYQVFQDKGKAEGWSEDWDMPEDWKKSFSIQVGNSKLGSSVASLSLTPVASCPKGILCAGQGCYALKAYRQYPQAKLAWDKNFELLKTPGGSEALVRDVDNLLATRRVSTKGEDGVKTLQKITKFRWNVAGDLFGKPYLDAILQIAKDNPDVLFWLYTKNFELVKGVTPPSNLVIILSAWNDWRIKDIDGDDETHSGKDGLHKYFPVAYVDDWDHKDLIPKDEDAFICPCADEKNTDLEDDRHCESCKTHSKRIGNENTHPCYMLRPGESVIFRMH